MSTTNGKVILTYDLDSKHTEVKSNMQERGYFTRLTLADNKTYTLPNTTLYKSGISTDQALLDIKYASEEEGAKLEKVLAVLSSDWAGYEIGV
jgi:hypothetical protein